LRHLSAEFSRLIEDCLVGFNLTGASSMANNDQCLIGAQATKRSQKALQCIYCVIRSAAASHRDQTNSLCLWLDFVAAKKDTSIYEYLHLRRDIVKVHRARQNNTIGRGEAIQDLLGIVFPCA